MIDFNSLWDFITKRGVCIVQERSELEHVFNLIQGCDSYLEVGTAEGNSLYVLAHALKPGARITCVDLGESHVKSHQERIMQALSPQYTVAMYHGNSVDPNTYPKKEKHDVVLIDGGHDYNTVLSDCYMYAPLATKFLIFHDVKLPDVKRAIGDYFKDLPQQKYYEFINSETMGFGIVKV